MRLIGDFIFAIGAIAGIVVAVYGGIYRYQHPWLTETHLAIMFWRHTLVALLFIVVGLTLKIMSGEERD